jgi:hypothetical protein
VRPRGELGEDFESRWRHAEIVQRDRAAAAIEEPKYYALPIHGRDGGYAEVELTRLEAYANAPVLRSSAFTDVQLGEQFDARDDCVMQLAWWLGCRHQHTIESKT